MKTNAKIEVAENYNRSYHNLKYNQGYPGAWHLVMHELVHLDFILEARKANSNKLFTSNESHRKAFMDITKPARMKLQKSGRDLNSINGFFESLFTGMNLQIYNTPIDLFIEEKLFNEYPDLRPYQFTSLFYLIGQGIKGTTNKTIINYTPPGIVQASKLLNLVNALQFRDLYGVDFLNEFQPAHNELDTAARLYEEFIEYRDDREPGEEYDLVDHWAKDLKLDKYFSFKEEK